MSHKLKELKEGALIVSDAHYSSWRPQFAQLITAIEKQQILTSQLILMGDIFDLLVSALTRSVTEHHTLISQLNALSKKIEIIYLEGNHDFLLQPLFPSIEVVPLQKQPLEMFYQSKKVLLLHGDKYVNWHYGLYAFIIRKHFLIASLQRLDRLFHGAILKKLERYLQKKNDCNTMTNFEAYIENRLKAQPLNTDYLIEGHYHQGKAFRVGDFEYINLHAFACKQRFFIVQSMKDALVLQHKSL